MLNRLFSALGLVRPNPSRMPKGHGTLRIRPKLGINTKTYFKALRKIMPFLTKEDEKVLREYYKGMEPGQRGWIKAFVSKKAWKAVYDEDDSKCKVLIEQEQSINCGCGRFLSGGCCGGPRVGKEENLEKTYYLQEFIGEKAFPLKKKVSMHDLLFCEVDDE